LQQRQRGLQGGRVGARGLQQLCRGPRDGRIDGSGAQLGCGGGVGDKWGRQPMLSSRPTNRVVAISRAYRSGDLDKGHRVGLSD